MRKFYSLFIALLTVCGLAQAQTTFDATVTLGNNTTASGEDTVTKDGITISTTSGGLGTGQQYRFAKGSTTTITSTVGNITKIVFTCTAEGDTKYGPGCFEAQEGYSYEGSVGTWTGSATEVSFVASTAQVRATTIAISINGKDPEGGETPDPQPGEIDWTSSATAPLTVAAVLEKAAKLEQGASSDKEVYVKGKISSITYTFDAEHGTATFSISDDGQPQNEFLCYGTYYLGNRAWAEGDNQIEEGDEVIVFGTVTNYRGTLEMASKKNYLYSLNGKTDGGTTPDPQPGEIDWTSSAPAPLTVAAVLEKAAKLEQGKSSDKEVYVKGKISQIKYTFSAQYGTSQFSISDNGQTEGEFLCYGTYYLGNRAWAEGDDQINVGDEVIVCGTVTNYNGTLEMANKKNYLYSLNGKTAGGDTPDPDVTEYTKIADMQAAAQGLGTEKVPVKFSFTEAIVLGVKSKNIYITAGGRGLLLYGTNSKNLKAGDVISGAITGELQLYNGVTELGNANFDNVSLLDIAIVATPVKATIADISNAATKLAYESMLVTIEDLSIVVDEGTVKGVDDSDNEVVLFDNYGFGLANLEFIDGETYNVTAIVGNYKGTIQLYPRTAEDIDGKFKEPDPYQLVGDGSQSNPFIVEDVLSFNIPSKNDTIQANAWVKGFIVGYIDGSNMNGVKFTAEGAGQTNIIIADAADATVVIPVALKSNGRARADLNLKDHPEMLGKQVMLRGVITQYMQANGLKEVTDYSLDGSVVLGIHSVTNAASAGTIYNLAGQRMQNMAKPGVYVVGGRKMVVK